MAEVSAAGAIRASVVIPVWNRENTLGRAIDSLLAQTCPNLEVIVVDNGSTDGTRQAVGARQDPRVRLVELPSNVGPSAARNAGAKLASGPIIGFLDSDDEVDPEWLGALLAPFGETDCAVTTCAAIKRSSCSRDTGSLLPLADMGSAFFGVRARFLAGTFLLRKDVFDVIGGYADELWYAENTELALRVTAWCSGANQRIEPIERPLTVWHSGPDDRYDALPERRLSAVNYTLRHHKGQLSRDRSLLASHYSIAGLCAVRLGRFAEARGYFLRAFATKPSQVKHIGQFIAATSQLTARVAWPRRPRVGPP